MSVLEGQERLVEVAASEAGSPERAPVGVEKTFRSYDPEQVLLMAPVLSEWLPEGHLAHFVSDLVESGALDLSAVYASYEEERGFPPYDPRLMVKLVVYGYAVGVSSSRKLERATLRGCGGADAVRGSAPGFPVGRPVPRSGTWRRCRSCLCESLRLCKEAELVGFGSLALDGTKLRANASRHKAMSYERMQRKEQELEAEIADAASGTCGGWFEEAERVDAEEDERLRARPARR